MPPRDRRVEIEAVCEFRAIEPKANLVPLILVSFASFYSLIMSIGYAYRSGFASPIGNYDRDFDLSMPNFVGLALVLAMPRSRVLLRLNCYLMIRNGCLTLALM